MDEWEKKGAKNPGKKLKIFILLFALMMIAGIAIMIFYVPKPGSILISSVPTCGDGSFYNTCSLDKPYYCYKGILVENVMTCGCPKTMSRQGLDCVSLYQSSLKTMNFNYIIDGHNGTINFTAYSGLYTYLSTIPESITYTDGQQPVRSDFKLLRIDEPNQEALIMPLVKDIENLAPHDKTDQARIAISLVQNIPWGSSYKTVSFGGQQADYSRYPYQVLYDNQGLCGEKSELLAMILKELGFGVVLFYYPKENHETLGIKCPAQYSLEGTGYCFVETSGPAIISDSEIIYSGDVTLSPSPDIILLSDGISLPDGMYEYRDAKVLAGLRSKGSALDPFSGEEFRQLDLRYGLSKVYNIN